jgi:hypothetical protein
MTNSPTHKQREASVGQKHHTGPKPSEQALIRIWDRIDEERRSKNEKAAEKLAVKALKAITPEQEQEK